MLQAFRTRVTWRNPLALGLAIGLHAGVIAVLLGAYQMPPTPLAPVTWISLASIPLPTVVETPAPQPLAAQSIPVTETLPPQPTPVAAVETPQATVTRPKPQPKLKPKPKVVRTPRTAPPTQTPADESPVTPRPIPVETAAAPEPAPVVPAHYNAAYLNNPAPTYPALSRRMGEQGKVLLRARVIPNGTPETVEIQQSSGSSRLDAAAREAVARWRFIPARQGEIILASWVLVPINFQLER